MNKFFEFKNVTKDSGDLYIYGEIVESKDGWFGSETDVSLLDFKQAIDDLGDIKNLNIYINSPGGSVFVASTMISMLQRLKDKGTTINAYVDGLSASAASFLMMIADNIYLYKNSIVMIHKPMAIAMGNSKDFQDMINTLDKIEDSVMIPMYLKKAVDNVNEAEIKQLLEDETWLNSSDMIKYFNVNILEDSKQIAACIDSKLFKNYKNAPKNLIGINNTIVKVDSDELIKAQEKIKIDILEKAKARLNLEVEI